MASESLAVWFNDLRIAVVERERKGKLRLSYTDEAHDTFAGGTPLLSIDLPLTRDRYSNERTCAFLDGLLPEGAPRNAIAADFDLPASDVFGLIAVLGKDCAGALVIQPDEQSPPAQPTTSTAEPLTSDDLAELVFNLRSAPLGVGRKVRLSLAGVQEKLLLTRLPDGSWGRPVDGTPSTHILKPEIERYENTVENEAFCMRVASNLGFSVANVETILVDDRPVLVVERFDRIVDGEGLVQRLHQEDFCQAFGLPPQRKYQEDGGPTLARIASTLRDYAEPEAPATFLCALTLSVALGNCDAHAKNFSLLHTDSGALRLAPLYDLMATRLYPIDDQLAMYVDTVQKSDRVTSDRIVNEAVQWGISRSRAEEVVAGLLRRMPDAVTAAADDTPGVPQELVELVNSRTTRLNGSGLRISS